MLSFLTLTGVVTTDLGVGDIGFVVGDPVLLLASSTLLAAGEEGFVDNGFAGDPLLLLSSSTLLAVGEGGFVDFKEIDFAGDPLLLLSSSAVGEDDLLSSGTLTGFDSLATAVHGGDLTMVRGLTSLVFVINTGGLISACHVPTNDPHGELGSLGMPVLKWPLSLAIISVIPRR